uniref:Maturase K n=1 Tax=Lindsaea linearis TaxID=641179 RepID=A0A5B9RBI9_9MONI|nr:maturase K [Lindsaea linearis]QEG57326.1 maturase K [Lindsaea linearis]
MGVISMIKLYDFPSTFSKLQEVGELTIHQECFWYPFPFLFRENVYSIAGHRCSNAAKNHSTFGTCSIIAAKRLIHRMRHQDYSDIIHLGFGLNNFNSINPNLYFRVLLETTCLVLEIPASYRVIDKTNKHYRFSQSIHSIFPFLEDNLPKSNYFLNIFMSRTNHLENLIRLSRRRIQDVSFLHLLRLVSYIYKASRVNIYKDIESKELRSINTPLWNFYLHDIDSLLIVLWKQLCDSQPKYFVSTDQTNMNRKERRLRLCAYEYQLKPSLVMFQSHFTRKVCVHYGRYKNHCFIVFRGTRFFAKKWTYYLCLFIEFNFHYRTEFRQMGIKLLSSGWVSLLGYTLTVQPVSNKVQVETAKESYTSILNVKQFYPIAPIILLVKLMAKDHFCDSIGRPLTKLGWVTSTDDDPLEKFAKIWGISYLYHSGSINRDGLRRSRYILQFSLNNTLASKHKITTRLSRRGFYLELPKTYFLRGYFSNQRAWYLGLVHPILITSSVVTQI